MNIRGVSLRRELKRRSEMLTLVEGGVSRQHRGTSKRQKGRRVVVFGQGTMPVIEENTGFIYCVEVNLDDVVGIRLVGLRLPPP